METKIAELKDLIYTRSTRNHKKASLHEEYLATNIDEAVLVKEFFDLPASSIQNIVKNGTFTDYKNVITFVKEMYKNKTAEESLNSLNYIHTDEFSLNEYIEIIAQYESSELCKKISESSKSGIDYKSEVDKLEKEIERLKKKAIMVGKPEGIEEDVYKAAKEGKISSLEYVMSKTKKDEKDEKETKTTKPAESDTDYGDCCDCETCAGTTSSMLKGASEAGQLETLKYLLEVCEMDDKETDTYGRNLLHAAARNGQAEIMEYLIKERHFDTNATDCESHTVQYFAVSSGRVDVVQVLVENCSFDVSKKDYYGNSIIHNASLWGCTDILKYLVETCHINVEDKSSRTGCTPLMLAASRDNIDIVEYLVEYCHANISATDNGGRNAIDYAKRNSNDEVASYLKSKLSSSPSEPKPERPSSPKPESKLAAKSPKKSVTKSSTKPKEAASPKPKIKKGYYTAKKEEEDEK